MRTVRRETLTLLGRTTATAIMLGLLVWWIGPADVAAHLKPVRWTPLLAVCVVLAVQFWLAVLRWQLIARRAGIRVPIGTLARASGASFFYGQFLPATAGADLVRIAAVARYSGVRRATASVVTDRLSGLFVLGAMAVALLPFSVAAMGLDGRYSVPAAAASAAAALGVAAVLGLRGPVRRWMADRVGVRLNQAADLIDSALDWRSLGLAFLVNCAPAVLVWLIALSTGANLALWTCFVLVPFAAILTALPISISGWGVREGALVAMFAQTGADPAAVLSVSVLYGLTGLVVGLAYAATLPFGRWGHGLPGMPK